MSAALTDGGSNSRIWPSTTDQLALVVWRPDFCQLTPVADHHQVVEVTLAAELAEGLAEGLTDAFAEGFAEVREPVAKTEGVAVAAEAGAAVLAVATSALPMPKSEVTLAGRCQSDLKVQVRPSGEVQAVVAPWRAASVPTATKP